MHLHPLPQAFLSASLALAVPPVQKGSAPPETPVPASPQPPAPQPPPGPLPTPGSQATPGSESAPGSQPAPGSEAAPGSGAGSQPAAEALFSLDTHQQDIEVTLRAFAKACDVPISLPDLPTNLVSLSFKNLPFEKALKQILAAGNLDFRRVEAGYAVGLPLDLKLRFPEPGEKELDAVYRCRHVGAGSLVDAIGKILPDVKISTGPLYLSPALEQGSSTGGGGEQIRTIAATDASFRTHDVVFSGPPAQVRRALALAQKFDRLRKQVRITIKIVAVDGDASQELGVQWMPSLGFTATEQPSTDANGTVGTLVNGIRLGKFAHTPLVVNATLNALEARGHSRTLSNPTLLLLDGERSFILSGERYQYPRYQGKDQNGQSLYDVGEAKIGVYLQVGVQIGLDNDMILSLYPQVTSLGASRVINGAEYPTILTSEEQTTVRATSGEMVVLGGLLQDNDTFRNSGLPFLSRIPLLGRLFSETSTSKKKTELMLMVTPELLEETLPRAEVNLEVTRPAP